MLQKNSKGAKAQMYLSVSWPLMIFFMSQVNMFWEKEKTKDEEVAVASPLLITDWLTYISEKFNLLILQL